MQHFRILSPNLNVFNNVKTEKLHEKINTNIFNNNVSESIRDDSLCNKCDEFK